MGSIDMPNGMIHPPSVDNQDQPIEASVTAAYVPDLENHEQFETPGKLFVEKHFHPHPELPDSMPEQVKKTIEDEIEDERERKGYSRRSDKKLLYSSVEELQRTWVAVRSGGAGLIEPRYDWDSATERVLELLAKQELNAQEQEDGVVLELVTYLRHLQHELHTALLYLNLLGRYEAFKDFALDTEPEDLKQRFAEAIDKANQRQESYNAILDQVEGQKNKKERMSDEQKLECYDELENLGLEMTMVLCQPPKIDDVPKMIKLTKGRESITGWPFYVQLAFFAKNLNRDVVTEITYQLADEEKEIFNDILWSIRNDELRYESMNIIRNREIRNWAEWMVALEKRAKREFEILIGE